VEGAARKAFELRHACGDRLADEDRRWVRGEYLYAGRRAGDGVKAVRAPVALVVSALLAGCSPFGSDNHVFTLYRNSALDQSSMRVHVASFDTNEGEQYNFENCEVARQLFQAQEGVTTRFWCEKGRYRS